MKLVVGSDVPEDLVKTLLGAKFTREERHVRRLGKIKALETKSRAGARV